MSVYGTLCMDFTVYVMKISTSDIANVYYTYIS